VRIASGSFQGLSVGIGAAQAKKLNGDKHIIYTLHGDGELQEGQNWKPLCMPLPKVDNLIATIDLNGKQIDGSTDEVLYGIRAKFEALTDVLEIEKGNDIEAIIAGMNDAKSRTGKGKPVCVLLHTEMGKWCRFYDVQSHGTVAPNDTQLEILWVKTILEAESDY
jgi:transketolase